ncbi:hypothetical protein SLE2022_232530 [Rubroshorea leprosula]
MPPSVAAAACVLRPPKSPLPPGSREGSSQAASSWPPPLMGRLAVHDVHVGKLFVEIAQLSHEPKNRCVNCQQKKQVSVRGCAYEKGCKY